MRVLIVDDSAPIRSEVRRLLEDAGLDVTCTDADNGVDALKALMGGAIDLVLCDVQMPQMDGFQFLRMFRARPETQAVPVIMLTGRDNTEEKIFGLESGATDYVTKPFIPGELVARVKVQLKLKALQDDLKQANDRLREVSVTDYLTGLYNRRHFSELLDNELRRATRYNTPVSLAVLDIDHFKRINDTYGHQTGDAVLSEFARVVKSALRSTDLIARYGGEEFVVLLPHTVAADARTAIDKIRAVLAEAALGGLARGQVCFSAGIACFPSEQATHAETLVACADKALYAAKESGRNRTVLDGEDAAAAKRIP